MSLSRSLIICGWKPEFERVLADIRVQQPDVGFCIVTQRKEGVAEACVGAGISAGSFSVHEGDAYSDALLKKLPLTEASQAMLLADWSDRGSSVTETDAKTVMTAMAIERLAPSLYVSAEILDTDFLPYFRMARVDEIIYSREYSRTLLARSVGQPGVGHVVAELLNASSASVLSVLAPLDADIGKPFEEVAERVESAATRPLICVGVLENTENLLLLKKRALSSAQKNPEMRDILSQLARVKEIEANRPVLAPPMGYRIPGDSMLLVLKKAGSA